MEETELSQDCILSTFGLSRRMHHIDRGQFRTYVPSDYTGSETEERDAVHRMSEIVLLHAHTGLRFTYLSSESYYGDSVEYIFMDIHIVTSGGRAHKVLDVNFEKSIVIVENIQVPFSDLSRQV